MSQLETSLLTHTSNGGYPNRTVTQHYANGIVISQTDTSSDGYVDYSGPTFERSTTYQYVPPGASGDGRHLIVLTVSAHIESICIGCSTEPTYEGWLKSNSDGKLEDRVHNIPLNFLRPKWENWNGTKFRLVKTSNALNELWPKINDNYDKAKQLNEGIDGQNELLNQAVINNAATAKSLLDKSEDLISETVKFEKHEMDSSIDAKSDRNSRIIESINSENYQSLSSSALSAHLDDKLGNLSSNLNLISNSLASRSSSMSLPNSDLISYGGEVDRLVNDLVSSTSDDFYYAKDETDPQNYLDDTNPSIPVISVPNANPLDKPLAPFGGELKTPKSDANYQKLADAVDYYNAVGELIEDSTDIGVKYAHELAGVGLVIADEEYAENNIELGDSLIESSLFLLDTALDFVPGAALLKDSITIMTGVNPITGEAVSDTERTVLLGAIFVPAALAGTAKVVTKAAKVFKKIAGKGRANANGPLCVRVVVVFYNMYRAAMRSHDKALN